jgi:hypothetical protein
VCLSGASFFFPNKEINAFVGWKWILTLQRKRCMKTKRKFPCEELMHQLAENGLPYLRL